MKDRGWYHRHFRRAMDPEVRADTVRFEAGPPYDTFSVEYTAGTEFTDAYWNVATFPPCDAEDLTDWTVEDSDDAFVLVESEAETPEEAFDELEQLVTDTAGEDTRVTYKKTFRAVKSPKIHLKSLAKRAKGVVSAVMSA